jgi:hypothetical protein
MWKHCVRASVCLVCGIWRDVLLRVCVCACVCVREAAVRG